MANMKHKSPDARRTRRQRYTAAVDPIRKQYNCTAAEIPSVMARIERDARQAKGENTKLKADVEFLGNALKKIKDILTNEDDTPDGYLERIKEIVDAIPVA